MAYTEEECAALLKERDDLVANLRWLEAQFRNLKSGEDERAQRAYIDRCEVEERREEATVLRIEVARLTTAVDVLRERCQKRGAELRALKAKVGTKNFKTAARHRATLLERVALAVGAASWDEAVAMVEAMYNPGDAPREE